MAGIGDADPWLDEKQDLLKELALFSSLDGEAKDELAAVGKVEQHWQGEVIVREGEPGNAFFLVMRGFVAVSALGAAGEVTLGNLGRGGCFGEVALLSGQRRTATVTAFDDTMVVRFEDEHLSPVLERFPRVRKLLEALVAGRARQTIERLL